MMKEEASGRNSGCEKAAATSWARVCDTCRSAACAVYCRADSAYLCAGCDARVHAANPVASRHERVWVCEACERAPAAFICKADAASLCSSCDADIHSANPLARRHHRVPVTPISGSLPGPPSSAAAAAKNEDIFNENDNNDDEYDDDDDDNNEDETASWLLLNPVKNTGININLGNNNINNTSTGFLFGGEVDEYLDLVEYNSSTGTGDHEINHYGDQFNSHHHQQMGYGVIPQKNYGGGDSVVPVQCGDGINKGQMMQQSQGFQLGLEFDSPKGAYTSSFNGSISHSVSVSSVDVSVVPDSTMSDISISHPARPPKGTIDLFSGPPIQMPTQLTPMDREARVLRYREKKKTRKFEKTIRYASRKAYAETRPRIKGRFAKRTDLVDQMFSTALMADTGYGIVPSF